MIVLQILLDAVLIAVFGIGCIAVIGIICAAVEDRRLTRDEKQQRPEPVNAIAENVTWKHERRVMDAAKWDTDFYELEHGEPMPAWAQDSLVLGQVPPPTGPPREPPAWMWRDHEQPAPKARRRP